MAAKQTKMKSYHCSLGQIDAPLPSRIALWTLNGVTRMGNARKLTKGEKQMLKPAKAVGQSRKANKNPRYANFDEYQ